MFHRLASGPSEMHTALRRLAKTTTATMAKRRRERKMVINQRRTQSHTTGPYVKPDFLTVATTDVYHGCLIEFIDATSNEALRQAVCMICAQRWFFRETRLCAVQDIPNKGRLECDPTNVHAVPTMGLLLHRRALFLKDEKLCGQICVECWRDLAVKDDIPLYSLANRMWIGDVPTALRILTLPERLLIALYIPIAFVVKLYPKTLWGERWDEDLLAEGLRGNVSTYRLNTDLLASRILGAALPHDASVLSSCIVITFVGPRKKPEKTLKGLFRVRRRRVADALYWLHENNSLWQNITIDMRRIAALPEDDVPEDLADVVRVQPDISTVQKESAGYVPDVPSAGQSHPLPLESDPTHQSR